MRLVCSAFLAIATLAFSAACDDDNNAPRTLAGPSVVDGAVSVSITGTQQQLAVGQSVALRATARMSDGSTRDVSNDAAWRSSNTAVCTASAGGVVTGVGAGTCDVTATYDSQSSTSGFLVVGSGGGTSSFGSISIHGPRTLTVGQRDRFVVMARNADGSLRDVSSSATFSSSNAAVADVDRDGRVEARAPGSATVSATAGGSQAAIDVVVSPAGGGGGGGDGTGGGGGGGGTPPGGPGTGTGGGGVTGVCTSPIAGLDVTGTTGVGLGGSSQLTATARMSDGSTANVTSDASWASDNPGITVGEDGLVSVVGSLASLLLDPDALLTVSCGGQTTNVTVRATGL